MNETLNGTTMYTGSESGVRGLPDHESDVGGYEDYPSETRDAGWDSDADGLPDFWELDAGTNPDSPSGDFTEANTDFDGDGYTELEEYLAFMAAPQRVRKKALQPLLLPLMRHFGRLAAALLPPPGPVTYLQPGNVIHGMSFLLYAALASATETRLLLLYRDGLEEIGPLPLERVGRHKLTLCTCLPCGLQGALETADYLRAKLGIDFNETTPDGRFTLKEGECMGACAMAPVLLVNNKKMHDYMSNEKIDRLLESLK